MSGVNFSPVLNGIQYGCHPAHRNRSPDKSQWTIEPLEEIACFIHTHQQGWIVGTRAWGLHLINGNPRYLGTTHDRARILFVARFEDGTSSNQWHGYPADHQTKTNDRLPEEIKELWTRNRVLPPAKIRKLAKGQRCNL